jgi:phosphate starvation-inducible membrane PsiE
VRELVTRYNKTIFWKNLCIFQPREVTYYDESILKNLFIFFPGQVTHDYSIISRIFEFHLWVRFLALTSNTFKTIHHFLIWWVHYLFVFLLYKAYNLKFPTSLSIISIAKKKGNNHNPFLGYSPNLFFLPKLKKYIQNKKNKSKKNNSSEKRMAEHL